MSERWTQKEFEEYAIENQLSCGTHYIVYADGVIQEFTIWADTYTDPIEDLIYPKDDNYHKHALWARQSKTTIFQYHG